MTLGKVTTDVHEPPPFAKAVGGSVRFGRRIWYDDIELARVDSFELKVHLIGDNTPDERPCDGSVRRFEEVPKFKDQTSGNVYFNEMGYVLHEKVEIDDVVHFTIDTTEGDQCRERTVLQDVENSVKVKHAKDVLVHVCK